MGQAGPTSLEDRERASVERETHTYTPLVDKAGTQCHVLGSHTFHSDHQQEVQIQEVQVQEVAVIMERNPAYAPIGAPGRKRMKSEVDVQYVIPQLRCSEGDHFPDIQMQSNPAYSMHEATNSSNLFLKKSDARWLEEGFPTPYPEDSPSKHARLQAKPSYIHSACTEGTLQLKMGQNMTETEETSKTSTEEVSTSAHTAGSSLSTHRATDEETDYDYVITDRVNLQPSQLLTSSYKHSSTTPTTGGARNGVTEAPPTGGLSSEVEIPIYI